MFKFKNYLCGGSSIVIDGEGQREDFKAMELYLESPFNVDVDIMPLSEVEKIFRAFAEKRKAELPRFTPDGIPITLENKFDDAIYNYLYEYWKTNSGEYDPKKDVIPESEMNKMHPKTKNEFQFEKWLFEQYGMTKKEEREYTVKGNLLSLGEIAEGYFTITGIGVIKKGIAYLAANKISKETLLKAFLGQTDDVLKDVTKKEFTKEVTNSVGRIFKSDSDIANHLEKVVKFNRDASKGITGGHNMDEFYNYMKNQLKLSESEFIEKITKHPDIDGIYEITYKIPVKDIYGNLTGRYKIFKFPKTVYDTKVITTQEIIDWGKLALDSKDAVIKGRIIDGVSPNGLKFRGYLNDAGEITNFHPIFEGR